MLTVAFGEQTVGRTQVFEWLSKFEVSVASVEEAECLGVHWWAKHENVDWVMTVALENRWVAICEVAKMLCISLRLVLIGVWKTIWTCIGLLPNSCCAPAHSALSLCEFLAKNVMAVFWHPPFSVDVVPYCFTLFSDLVIVIRRSNYVTMILARSRDAFSEFQIILTEMLQMVAQLLGLLCKAPRRLLWRG